MSKKLQVITDIHPGIFECEVAEFLSKENNVIKTSYTTSINPKNEVIYTAFIEYRACDE